MIKKFTPTINHFVALVKLNPLDNSSRFVEEIADGIVESLNLHVVKKTLYKFHPEGLTSAYILSESHLLIHTWPKFGMLHIDLVTCSKCNGHEFRNSLTTVFSKYNIESIEIKSPNFDLS